MSCVNARTSRKSGVSQSLRTPYVLNPKSTIGTDSAAEVMTPPYVVAPTRKICWFHRSRRRREANTLMRMGSCLQASHLIHVGRLVLTHLPSTVETAAA